MGQQKTELVVKSNRLVEASYRLTLVEQQIVLFAICRAREEQKGLFADVPLTLRADEFAQQFGIGSDNVYRQLKDAMDTLFNRHVVIHDTHPESGKPRVTKTRWISQASYIDGAGIVQFIFAPGVIPFVTRLGGEDGFTSYRLEKIGKMTSAHAVRMYEMLVQYISIGKREVALDWLRDVLQIGNDEYPRIVNFKLRVVDVAVAQINEHSDIVVSYEQRKTGRTVTHLMFTVREKAEAKPKPKKEKIDRTFVEKHARPGESHDQAYRRLAEERGQPRLVD